MIGLKNYERRFTLNVIFGGINLIQDGDGVGSGLAGAVLGSGQDVSAGLCDRDGGFLDGRGLFPAHLENAHQKLT